MVIWSEPYTVRVIVYIWVMVIKHKSYISKPRKIWTHISGDNVWWNLYIDIFNTLLLSITAEAGCYEKIIILVFIVHKWGNLYLASQVG